MLIVFTFAGGVALRKHSKENIMAGTHVGGANRIVKAKLAAGSTQAKKATKSGYARMY